MKVPVAHVEAGLRSYDLDHPFPEEGNRQLVSRITKWHFAPTEQSKEIYSMNKFRQSSLRLQAIQLLMRCI